MADFKKSGSRAKAIVEGAGIHPAVSYKGGKCCYVASLSEAGGPPYRYFDLELSREEMLTLALGWLTLMREDDKRVEKALQKA